jgi:hypothetical protein
LGAVKIHGQEGRILEHAIEYLLPVVHQLGHHVMRTPDCVLITTKSGALAAVLVLRTSELAVGRLAELVIHHERRGEAVLGP